MIAACSLTPRWRRRSLPTSSSLRTSNSTSWAAAPGRYWGCYACIAIPDRGWCSAARSDAVSIFWRSPVSERRAPRVGLGQEFRAQAFATNGSGANPVTRGLNGMSHGAAGFAYALSSLAAATGREDFAKAASECIAYEDATYDDMHHNWPDWRGSNAPTWPCQWCHGAPGIGLARLGMQRFGGKAAKLCAERWRRIFATPLSVSSGRRPAPWIRFAAARSAGSNLFARRPARSVAPIFASLPHGGFGGAAASGRNRRLPLEQRQAAIQSRPVSRSVRRRLYAAAAGHGARRRHIIAERADLGIAVRRRTHCCCRRLARGDQHRFEHVEGLHLHLTFGRRRRVLHR